MFGISFPELLIIFVIVILFFGPDKLPEAARKLGKFMAEIKRSSDAVRKEFYNTVYTPVEAIQRDVKRELATAKIMLEDPIDTSPSDEEVRPNCDSKVKGDGQ